MAGLINTSGMMAARSASLPSSVRVEGRSVTPRRSRTVNCKALADLLGGEADALVGAHGFEHGGGKP